MSKGKLNIILLILILSSCGVRRYIPAGERLYKGASIHVTKNPEIFETRSIPRTYVLDKKGNIAIDKSGAADWNSDSVRKLLDKLLKAE